MNGLNLSDWALRHRSFIWYLMIAAVIAGALSYTRLGREEDPSFDIKTMVVQVQWPGATLDETINQVTDRVEKELQQIATLDYTRSYTKPGSATIMVNLKDTTNGRALSDAFYQIRKHVNDIWYTLPSGVQGPYFNDEFGDVYGNVYAFTADGISFRQLRDYVEVVRNRVLSVPGAGKTQILGALDEVIYLDFDTGRLSSLGVDRQSVIASLQAQNAVSASGVVQAGEDRVSVRVGGGFKSEDDLRAINLRVNDRFFRLSDVATITRGYEDPPSSLFRYDGQPAIGLAVAMAPNGNLLQFGEDLKAAMKDVTATLPIGVGVHLVSDQPAVVEEAISGFTRALMEAVIIVMAVSFVSLGLRAGLVVAISIPLVLAIVFIVMEYSGISLQRISLGALIIALGLLVDDAMITVEMMISRLEAGDTLRKAATYAFTSTAMPMLTGTLVTVAGFIPIGLNDSSAGQYTFTLFVVIAVALLVSWIVAVVFAPLLGVTILPRSMKRHDEKPSRFTAAFKALLLGAMRWRWLTIAVCLGLLAASVVGMGHVQQQFFPSSDRPELLVDMTLPQNSTIAETKARMDDFEKAFVGDDDVERWSSYVGQGAVRFYLPLDQQLSNPFFGQIVVVTKGLEARERVRARLDTLARDKFVGIDVLVHPLELGPPVGRPVQYRVSGPDIQGVREQAIKLAGVIADDPSLGTITYDWNEPGRVLRVEVDQNKARLLGVTSQDIASILNGTLAGSAFTQVRDDIYLVNVVGRAQADQRDSLETLENLQISLTGGTVVPLRAVATIGYAMEQPIVWRRSRLPTVTVSAAVVGDIQPATVVQHLQAKIAAFSAQLPPYFKLEVGGAVEAAGKGQSPIVAIVPIMLLTMLTVLMIQLQSFQKLFLVVSVAPLGLIGVVLGLLPFGQPLGFVAILGVLALIGIIIRNSVILVKQIEDHEREGMERWAAVVNATVHRMRPILLTAAAASLGMIPIAREVFWGPMAYAMIGGILVATLLTLLFLPALYVTWYRVKEPKAAG
ncbi:efflux RND transporter permease subunit [Labrys monachus]|uniref:Multidrug efflux pump subunit AcrB n=1 Tax=Labrys monachus TaxID=217067 RepID=A0ABU0F876_9HYPH|nr:efflux RND transporter permease subunit [Labrys monachus]MDQ0390785.1 multidrug efflux pump subunit AcrB [Labrys monachus]